jgi:Protein of unknown function (DUF4232)
MIPLARLVRLVPPTAAAVAAVLAAGCGSAPAPAGGPAGATVSSPAAGSPAASGASTPATVTACATPALRVTLDSSAAGAAAGSSFVPLEFTNASGASCTLAGYPAVAFASGTGGPQIGAAAAAEASTHPATLVLAPGGVAHAWLQIVDVGNYPASQCQPVTAGGLRVGFTGAAAFLAHPFQACAKTVHGSDVLAVFPVQAGVPQRGTAP